jgi:hypothetical protein
LAPRRIAESGIGTTLRAGLQRQSIARVGRALDRQLDLETIPIDLDLTEELILFGLGRGQPGLADADPWRRALEAKLALIQVVAFGDLPAHPHDIRPRGLG